MIHLPIAIEIANDRIREANNRALVAAAGHTAFGQPGSAPRRNRARSLIARPVRALSDASHALSEAACSAATRIEGAAH